MRGALMRMEREHDERAWLAWHVAALPKQQKFPKLEALLTRKRAPRKKSPDELWAIAKQWHHAIKGRPQ